MYSPRRIGEYRYLSSTPGEDHVSKARVFLIVLYVSSYIKCEYISLELFCFVNLTSSCSLIPFNKIVNQKIFFIFDASVFG